MNLHRALSLLACAALLIGLAGCEMGNPYKSTYPASESSANMQNTQWQVSGEESPPASTPEATPAAEPAK